MGLGTCTEVPWLTWPYYELQMLTNEGVPAILVAGDLIVVVVASAIAARQRRLQKKDMGSTTTDPGGAQGFILLKSTLTLLLTC